VGYRVWILCSHIEDSEIGRDKIMIEGLFLILYVCSGNKVFGILSGSYMILSCIIRWVVAISEHSNEQI
jgi:hypothetical protein